MWFNLHHCNLTKYSNILPLGSTNNISSAISPVVQSAISTKYNVINQRIQYLVYNICYTISGIQYLVHNIWISGKWNDVLGLCCAHCLGQADAGENEVTLTINLKQELLQVNLVKSSQSHLYIYIYVNNLIVKYANNWYPIVNKLNL